MLTIRFQRTGRKNDPSFRIVVSEKTKHPKAGSPLEVVGSYNPKTKHTVIQEDRVKHWVGNGAQLSGTVNNLLVTKGVIQGKKVNVLQKKSMPKKEEEAKAEAAPAPAGEAPAAEAPSEAPAEEAKAE